jgi:hypothetical protein
MASFLVCRIEESAYGVSRSYTALHRLIFVRNAFSLIREDHCGGAFGFFDGGGALHPSGLLAAKFPSRPPTIESSPDTPWP